MVISFIFTVDFTFPYRRPTKLGIQDSQQGGIRLQDTSFDHSDLRFMV
jgi:hypothetical protein